MAALETSDGNRAAGVCSDDVRIVPPGGGSDMEGRDAVRQFVKRAPSFIRRIREEHVEGNTVTLKGLTRAPGMFANFTTWTFETDGERITHLSFAWRPAN